MNWKNRFNNAAQRRKSDEAMALLMEQARQLGLLKDEEPPQDPNEVVNVTQPVVEETSTLEAKLE